MACADAPHRVGLARSVEIAQVINEDFQSFRSTIAKVRAKAAGGVDLLGISSDDEVENDELSPGEDILAESIHPSGSAGATGDTNQTDGAARDLQPVLRAQDDGSVKGRPRQK